MAAQTEHRWRRQLREQQAEPWKPGDSVGNVCPQSPESSLVIMRDGARQTHSVRRAQHPGVSTGRRGSRASGGDPSRWQRWPRAGLQALWPEEGSQPARTESSLAEELAGTSREGQPLSVASVWEACRPTAVRATESLGSKKRNFSSPVTRAGLSIELKNEQE